MERAYLMKCTKDDILSNSLGCSDFYYAEQTKSCDGQWQIGKMCTDFRRILSLRMDGTTASLWVNTVVWGLCMPLPCVEGFMIYFLLFHSISVHLGIDVNGQCNFSTFLFLAMSLSKLERSFQGSLTGVVQCHQLRYCRLECLNLKKLKTFTTP